MRMIEDYYESSPDKNLQYICRALHIFCWNFYACEDYYDSSPNKNLEYIYLWWVLALGLGVAHLTVCMPQ